MVAVSGRFAPSWAHITRPLSRGEVAAVEAGMDRHAMLVFHDQRLTYERSAGASAPSKTLGAAISR